MFDTAMLVLLYNKEINQSSTISSIVDSSVRYTNAKIVIWNNGPKPLKERNISSLSALGYQVKIMETLHNESLAVIYNQFISETNATRYILLDDDSRLNDDYISSSLLNDQFSVSMPVITARDKIEFPKVNTIPYSSTCRITTTSKVTTIGSGLVIGSKIGEQLKLAYGNIFDERFYLYGVDTTFCLRLFAQKLTDKIKIIRGFRHSLSRLEQESPEKVEFRKLERSYDYGLTLRYYYPRSQAISILVPAAISMTKRYILKQSSDFKLLPLLKSFIVGKHYRKKG